MRSLKKRNRKVLSCMLLMVFFNPASAWAAEVTYQFSGTVQEFGTPTSTEEQIIETAEIQNHNRSKNAACIPPEFGSMTSYTLDYMERLTPNLLREADQKETSGILRLDDAVLQHPAESLFTESENSLECKKEWFTTVTDGLYYAQGHIGQLEIPSIGLSARVYEGESADNMKKGVAHMSDSSVWSGNVVLCAHNRGASSYFGKIHTMKHGDRITFTTKMGRKVYEVTEVKKIRETDMTVLQPTWEDRLTLVTCVRNESAYRYAVTAIRVS